LLSPPDEQPGDFALAWRQVVQREPQWFQLGGTGRSERHRYLVLTGIIAAEAGGLDREPLARGQLDAGARRAGLVPTTDSERPAGDRVHRRRQLQAALVIRRELLEPEAGLVGGRRSRGRRD
jgi:hypothetical protein